MWKEDAEGRGVGSGGTPGAPAMPLLRREPFIRRKPPKNVGPDDELFLCKLTGEVFTDYEWVFVNLVYKLRFNHSVLFDLEPQCYLIEFRSPMTSSDAETDSKPIIIIITIIYFENSL